MVGQDLQSQDMSLENFWGSAISILLRLTTYILVRCQRGVGGYCAEYRQQLYDICTGYRMYSIET